MKDAKANNYVMLIFFVFCYNEKYRKHFFFCLSTLGRDGQALILWQLLNYISHDAWLLLLVEISKAEKAA